MPASFINSNSGRFPAIVFLRCLVVTLGFLIFLPNLCQAETPLAGTITTKDGQPILGVKVYGSLLETFYPYKREQAKTNAQGYFRLEHPGKVVHFFKDDFQPQSLVVNAPSLNVHVTLEPSSGSLVVPPCGKRIRGQARIGWGPGNDVFWFNVPKHDVRILGGKWDVDYVRYVIKPRKGESSMELWFGLYAMDRDPPDEIFINSADFGQRNVVESGGALLGVDTWGHLKSGKSWRQTQVGGVGGASYQDAVPDEAVFFDQIINTLCEAPRSVR